MEIYCMCNYLFVTGHMEPAMKNIIAMCVKIIDMARFINLFFYGSFLVLFYQDGTRHDK